MRTPSQSHLSPNDICQRTSRLSNLPVLLTDESRFALNCMSPTWQSLETLWTVFHYLLHHPASVVWRWVSNGLGRHFFGSQHSWWRLQALCGWSVSVAVPAWWRHWCYWLVCVFPRSESSTLSTSGSPCLTLSSNNARLHHRLFRSWLILESRSRRGCVTRQLALSAGACPGFVGRSYRHEEATHYWTLFWIILRDFHWRWINLYSEFPFFVWVGCQIQTLMGKFHFVWLFLCDKYIVWAGKFSFFAI